MCVKPAPRTMDGLRLRRQIPSREAIDICEAVQRREPVRSTGERVCRSRVLERPDGVTVVAAEVAGAIVLVWLRGRLGNWFTTDVLHAEEWRP